MVIYIYKTGFVIDKIFWTGLLLFEKMDYCIYKLILDYKHLL